MYSRKYKYFDADHFSPFKVINLTLTKTLPPCAAGKESQLCAHCETSADCGPLGAHATLPDVIGGLPKGHILAAHYPTVCHHRSCVPLQVPNKDGFCRELREAGHLQLLTEETKPQQQQQHSTEQQRQQQQPVFSLTRFTKKLYKPVAEASAAQPATKRSGTGRRLAQTPRINYAPAPASSYNYTQQGSSSGAAAQPQGSAAAATNHPASPSNGGLIGGQLSQNAGVQGSRGNLVYQGSVAQAQPQHTLGTAPTANANPSLVDTSSVTDMSQQQLRAAPIAR